MGYSGNLFEMPKVISSSRGAWGMAVPTFKFFEFSEWNGSTFHQSFLRKLLYYYSAEKLFYFYSCFICSVFKNECTYYYISCLQLNDMVSPVMFMKSKRLYLTVQQLILFIWPITWDQAYHIL